MMAKIVGCLLLVACGQPIDPRHRDFCVATRWAVHDDRMDFSSTDPDKQEAAALRFYESQVIYHSSTSLLMCLDRIPTYPVMCWLDRRFDCLATVAQQIETELEVWTQ